MSYPFDPDWVIRPGATLREWMERRFLPLDPAEVAAMCQLPTETVEGILDGTVEITMPIAQSLARATHIAPHLWLNLERNYRDGLAAGKSDIS